MKNPKSEPVDLESDMYKTHVFKQKTGTTIVGLLFRDGVILGADSRTTLGKEVYDHEAMKIYKLQQNIYFCGAGYELHCQTLFEDTKGKLKKIEGEITVDMVSALLRSCMREKVLGAEVILGGVDRNGPHLCLIYPVGRPMIGPYVAAGSGGIPAKDFLLSTYHGSITRDEAIDMAFAAINHGIRNDKSSGGKMVLSVMTRADVEADFIEREPTILTRARQ